jgi:transcriptional regulator with XRE-family HTH domain
VTNAEIKTHLADFGQRVRQVRLEMVMSLRELDQRSHVGFRFLGELELGKENPSLATIIRIADGLGCDLVDLFPPQS